MNRVSRMAAVAALSAGMLVAGMIPAVAGPTCADFAPLGVQVHGQHVVRDYVTGGSAGLWPPAGGVGSAIAGQGAAVPGGPGPGFHFEHGFAPGASFCLSQSRSPGFHQ